MTRYWINTISLDHVELGVIGGFTQADHGRNTRLRRLERADWLRTVRGVGYTLRAEP